MQAAIELEKLVRHRNKRLKTQTPKMANEGELMGKSLKLN